MVGAELGLSLIKKLAACHRPTRDKAVRTILKSWLPAQAHVPEDDMKKLWKGLFYGVWHADKFPVQADLAEQLSSVIPVLQPSVSLQYFSVFLITMRREWSGIDKLRLDKFYLLIRRFMHYFFAVMRKCSWDLDFTRRLMGILVDNTFLADDNLLGAGVNYHVASVFLEELRPFLPLKKEVLEVLLGDFVGVMGKVGDKLLATKMKSCIFEELVSNGKRLLEVKKSGGETDMSDDVVVLGSIALVMKFSAKFYEVGSSQNCCQGNRKVLFQLYELFLKLEKDLDSSGIEVLNPEVNDNAGEGVIKSIPMDQDIEMDASGEASGAEQADGSVSEKKASKKGKKAKKLSGGSSKKAKKGKVSRSIDAVQETDNLVPTEAESIGPRESADGDTIVLNESVMSNLQLQFEKIAAESGLENDVPSACDMPSVAVNGNISKKRKRSKNKKGQQHEDAGQTGEGDGGGDVTAATAEKSTKRVKFAMKNNLVWKPHTPLPPRSLRLPATATPRGSALKKGVPPGPIAEMPPATKKVKKKSKSPKKARKVVRVAIVPARKKKLKSVVV